MGETRKRNGKKIWWENWEFLSEEARRRGGTFKVQTDKEIVTNLA